MRDEKISADELLASLAGEQLTEEYFPPQPDDGKDLDDWDVYATEEYENRSGDLDWYIQKAREILSA